MANPGSGYSKRPYGRHAPTLKANSPFSKQHSSKMQGLKATQHAMPMPVPKPSDGNREDAEFLDLTNYHLPDLSNITVSASLKVADLTTNRLTSIDPRLLALTGLEKICMRQNLLTDVTPWSEAQCKQTLNDMEFRDNQLTQIPDLSGFSSLTRLEFSYNQIKSMEPLSTLPPATPLTELDLAANKIATITSLSHLTGITTLELGSNRIRQIEGLDNLLGLKELWLGRNRITAINNIAHLTNLRRISLQSNRLESCKGLEACTGLEELYLSHNGIQKLEGLSTLTRLKILDVSSNLLTHIEGLQGQTELEDLWLNDNNIPDLNDEFAAALAPLKNTLTVIYMEGNPAAKDQSYKLRMMQLLPNLQQLDANAIKK